MSKNNELWRFIRAIEDIIHYFQDRMFVPKVYTLLALIAFVLFLTALQHSSTFYAVCSMVIGLVVFLSFVILVETLTGLILL